MVRFIKSYLQDRTTTYAWSEAKSKTYEFSIGVPQGCKISPILACLYIALILLQLDDPDPESEHLILSYVDDMAIVVQSKDLNDNIEWLVAQFTKWKVAFRLFGLEVEDFKTELFQARARLTQVKYKPMYGRPLPNITILGDGGPVTIQPSDRWRYLGLIFDLSLSFAHHVEWWVNKAYSTIRAMNILGNSSRGFSPSNKQQLYLTVVIPTMTYGFQLWYRPGARKRKMLLRKLITVQHKVARWITGGFKTPPVGGLEILAGLAPLRINLDRLYLKSAIRTATLHEGSGSLYFRHVPFAWETKSGHRVQGTAPGH
jgi:hypothetical protein